MFIHQIGNLTPQIEDLTGRPIVELTLLCMDLSDSRCAMNVTVTCKQYIVGIHAYDPIFRYVHIIWVCVCSLFNSEMRLLPILG